MKFQHPLLDFEWTHGGTLRQALSNMPLQTFQCRGIIVQKNLGEFKEDLELFFVDSGCAYIVLE